MRTSKASGSAAEVVASRLSERVSLAGRPDNPHLPLVPEGVCHALPLGEPRTVCGASVEELAVFPGLVFAAATFLHRCVECVSMIGLPG